MPPIAWLTVVLCLATLLSGYCAVFTNAAVHAKRAQLEHDGALPTWLITAGWSIHSSNKLMYSTLGLWRVGTGTLLLATLVSATLRRYHYVVEFVLSAAIRPSCMKSAIFNSPAPNSPLKMFQNGVIDFDDSFIMIPIPSLPPVGAHMFAQFDVKASAKSGDIRVVCTCSN